MTGMNVFEATAAIASEEVRRRELEDAKKVVEYREKGEQL
jgi:hypothetical protein